MCLFAFTFAFAFFCISICMRVCMCICMHFYVHVFIIRCLFNMYTAICMFLCVHLKYLAPHPNDRVCDKSLARGHRHLHREAEQVKKIKQNSIKQK